MNEAIDEPLMITRRDVAGLIQLSDRQVARLEGIGRIPQPIRLGASVRWPRRIIEEWIEAGCPAIAV